ncbi:hypothetical protein AMTRI_Chr01g104920 [Amborella trichopoda]
MKTNRDQIIHPMKKKPDEHEYTQNPVARKFHKGNANDCLTPRSMIQERMKEKTSAQEVPIEVKGINLQKAQDTPILDSRAGVDDPNLEVIDSQIQIEESNCSKNFETQENDERTRKISILDILVIHVTTKENDPISAVDDPHEAQVITELNRDLETMDSQDYICEEFLYLDSSNHEEAKESSIEDYVEPSINVNPKEDPSPKNR